VNRLHHAAWLVGTPARVGLIMLIHVYRFALSGSLGGQCRFSPTCSRYTEEAIREHGAIRGSLMAAWRIARCGPFTDGGYDPVRPGRRHSYDAVIHAEAGR
jgi:putative membrane protein insertion efficiency factor